MDRGQVFEFYAVGDPAAGATATGDGSVALVVAAAPVQAVSGRTEGVLSTATTTVQVVVSVPVDQAPVVLEAIGGRPLVVVVHGWVDVAAGAAATPSARPTATSSPASPSAPTVPSRAPVPPTPPAAPATPPAARTTPPAADPAVPPAASSATPSGEPGAAAPAVPATGTP